MGNTQATHQVFVNASEAKGAHSLYDLVFVKFGEENKSWSEVFKIDVKNQIDFKSGYPIVFDVHLKTSAKIVYLEIKRDAAVMNNALYLEKIAVKAIENKQISVFPINRHLQPVYRLQVSEFDTCLPTEDRHSIQRVSELRLRRKYYSLMAKENGIPLQLVETPVEERFEDEYDLFSNDAISESIAEDDVAHIFKDEFKSLEDLESFYYTCGVEKPKGIPRWRDDAEFGNQRIAGVNPAVIELCKKIPDNFKVASHMVEPFLEGKTLKQAMDEEKVYIVDYSFLQYLECSNDQKICAPYGLFYVAKNEDFMPIAIQLDSKPAEDNPVFLPSDPEYTWLMAKMWFNLADSSVHQSSAYFATTIIVSKSVALCANRNLSPSHPIYRLLAPHFHGAVPTSNNAMAEFMGLGEWYHNVTTIGRDGMIDIMRYKMDTWDLLENGHLINDLKRRGVYNSDSLPNYPYRDDAVLIWYPIETYVKDVVNGFYDSPEKLIGDFEIQHFIGELSEQKGAAIKGIPKGLANNSDLIDILTTLIFISSVQHTAIRLDQYNQYGFSPNYPLSIRTQRPKSKEPLSEEDIIKALPSKDTMFKILVVTNRMSVKSKDSLGHFRIQYAYHPKMVKALNKFKDNLEEADGKIQFRNRERKRQYKILRPKNISNNISLSQCL